jgi:hypothetical protein
MKHTPGPWALHIDELAVFGAEPDRQQVVDCVVSSPNLTDAERKANARLIAAAPELLAALHVAVRTIRTWHGMDLGAAEEPMWQTYQESPEMKVITSAIAKAEGQS